MTQSKSNTNYKNNTQVNPKGLGQRNNSVKSFAAKYYRKREIQIWSDRLQKVKFNNASVGLQWIYYS